MSTMKNSFIGTGMKKITQNDLRKLMTDHKKKLTQATRKIESPLAKYLDDGTLMCILCNSSVRSETVWNIHINAKVHKENIAKKKQPTIPPMPVLPSPPVSNDNNFKRPFPVKDLEEPVAPKKLKGILKNAPPLPQGFFDSEVSTPNSDAEEPPSATAEAPKENEENDESSKVETTPKEEPMEYHIVDVDLPEGFFDNPVLDAKARNVEYKDPIEEEWEKFQKEIKEENTVSAQIIQDDTEVATVERQIIEVDEQLKNWSRVLDLEKKKESVSSVKIKARDIKMEEESSSSEGEEYLDEFLDWRSKESYK